VSVQLVTVGVSLVAVLRHTHVSVQLVTVGVSLVAVLRHTRVSTASHCQRVFSSRHTHVSL